MLSEVKDKEEELNKMKKKTKPTHTQKNKIPGYLL